MFAIVFVVGGLLLMVALGVVVYLASSRGKADEPGRRTATSQSPETPERTEGRET